jgi:hypothetical protein
MIPTCISILFLAALVCLVVITRMLMRAGYGYEDESGYHDGMPGGE